MKKEINIKIEKSRYAPEFELLFRALKAENRKRKISNFFEKFRDKIITLYQKKKR